MTAIDWFHLSSPTYTVTMGDIIIGTGQTTYCQWRGMNITYNSESVFHHLYSHPIGSIL